MLFVRNQLEDVEDETSSPLLENVKMLTQRCQSPYSLLPYKLTWNRHGWPTRSVLYKRWFAVFRVNLQKKYYFSEMDSHQPSSLPTCEPSLRIVALGSTVRVLFQDSDTSVVLRFKKHFHQQPFCLRSPWETKEVPARSAGSGMPAMGVT